MSIHKIALTGGIGCGKSEAGRIFAALGVPVIDLDLIAKNLTAPGGEIFQALKNRFGKTIIRADGTLDRRALGDILFGEKTQKRWIENLMHPPILEKMEAEIQNLGDGLAVVIVPLLAEKNLTRHFDRAVVVDCDEKIQMQRLIRRDKISEPAAKMRMENQAQRAERFALGKKIPMHMIENNGTIFELKNKIEDLYKKLKDDF